MAKFNAQGIDGLALSMEEFAEIPDEIVEEMLLAGGEVVAEAQKRSILQLGLTDSRKLMKSIRAVPKVGLVDGIRKLFVLVYPYGKHHAYFRKAETRTYKNSKSGRTYTVGGKMQNVTNSEVGFIHEFGAPKRNIPARQWMRKANEASADAMTAAEFSVYDRWLRSKGL